MKVFLNNLTAIQHVIDKEVPEIVGNESVSHYRASFRNEGFTNSSVKKWKDVKRRTNPRDKTKAAASRPILTGSGDLGNSIRYKASTGLAPEFLFSDIFLLNIDRADMVAREKPPAAINSQMAARVTP